MNNLCSRISGIVVSILLSMTVVSQAKVAVDSAPAAWQSFPRMAPSPAARYDVKSSGQDIEFSLTGNVPDRRSMLWYRDAGNADLRSCRYFSLRYRALGIARDYSPLPLLVVNGKGVDGKPKSLTLLDSSFVRNDGRWHTVTRSLDCGLTAEAYELRLATNDSAGTFTLGALSFFEQPGEAESGVSFTPGWDRSILPAESFQCLDLAPLTNDAVAAAFDRSLAGKERCVVDGIRGFGADRVTLDGLPFQLVRGGNDLIRAPENASVNDEQRDFLGVSVPRVNYGPFGRADTTEIPVGRKVSEVCLLLVAEIPATHAAYACPARPFVIDDIEGFAVELRYADGESDYAFPYSPADGGYIVRRMAGAYAVPVDDGRVLKSVVVHNRYFGKSISVAAVTINTSRRRVLADVWSNPVVEASVSAPAPSERPFRVERQKSLVILENRFYRLEIDCARGFVFSRLVHRAAARTPVTMDPVSGLEIIIGDRILTGADFSVEEVRIDRNAAVLSLASRLSSVPLSLEVTLIGDATEELRIRASVTNVGGGPLNAGVNVPCLKSLRVGGLSDTWFYFPQYHTVCTNQAGFYRAANDRGFQVQFFDIYNPSAGVGIACLTRNLERLPLEYQVVKDGNGVSASVRYPADLYVLEAGRAKALPETVLAFHRGDWRQATDLYRRWLATWYRPYRAQGQDWFNKLSLVRALIPSSAYSGLVNRTPSLFDGRTNRFRIDELMKIEKEYYGRLPDMYVLFNWFFYDRENDSYNYGEYGPDSYANVGGLPVFKEAIRKFQEDYGVPVCLYVIVDRCSKSNICGRTYGERNAARRADGSPEADADTWYVCLGAKEWQDYFSGAVARLQKETGAKCIYVDVFPRERNWRCHSTSHGHALPFAMDMATESFIRKVKDALPPDVPVWSEFSYDDVSSRCGDGYITYNFMAMGREDIFTRIRDVPDRAPMVCEPVLDPARYLFSDCKVFALPCGIEGEEASWGWLKQIIFNGEATYDLTWRLYDHRALAFMRKSLELKKEYIDCFTAASAKPRVPTAQAGVYANEFPGRGRTLWMLFNGRSQTVRGTVLEVAHRTGVVYRDAWNNRALTPVVRNGRARISLKLDPQGVGCIVRTVK